MAVVPPLSAVSPAAPTTETRAETAKRVGREFESVFVGQMLDSMFSGVRADGLFGGGRAEDTWRGFMLDRYAREISRSGALGIGREIENVILKMTATEG